MASYWTLLIIAAAAVSAAYASTCTECSTAYTTAIGLAAATATTKCAAAKTFTTCLLSASGAGCDGVAAMVTTITTAVPTFAGCSLTATCTCQLTQLAAAITTNDLKCQVAATYTFCAYSQAATQAGCDASTLNSVYRYEARKLYSSTCTCSGHAIRFSFAMFLVVLAGMFFKN